MYEDKGVAGIWSKCSRRCCSDWRGGTFRAHNIVQTLAASGTKNLYVHGGKTVKKFLRAGLVDRPTVTRLLLLIGQGIPLFGSLEKDITLKHIDTCK